MSNNLITLEEVLRNVSKEVAKLEEMGRGLEDSISVLISRNSSEKSKYIKTLQEMDLIIQISSDINLFLSELPAAIKEGVYLKLDREVEMLKLARVRGAILGIEISDNSDGEITFL